MSTPIQNFSDEPYEPFQGSLPINITNTASDPSQEQFNAETPTQTNIPTGDSDLAHQLQEQFDAEMHPPAPTPVPEGAGPCQVGQYTPPRPYVRGNLIAPRTYGDCRNCDHADPIGLEPIQSIPRNQLVVLPSGNCMRRTDLSDFRPDASGRIHDPYTRQVLGGKKRKFRKTRKTKQSKKQKKTRKMRKSRKSRKAKKQKKTRKIK